MDYNTFQEAMEPVAGEQQIDALSIYRAFEQVEDGRRKRGVRYSVALILTLIELGKLAGMSSLAGIAQWVRLRAGWLSTVLPTAGKSFPCAATYSNVLRAVDAGQVTQVMNDLLRRVDATRGCGDEPSRLRGQTEQQQVQVHVASMARRCGAPWGTRPPISARCINWRSMKPALG